MRPPLRLTSPDNPRLKQVLHLRKHRDRQESKLFIAEGKREITRALAAGLPLREFFWSPELSGLNERTLQETFPPFGDTGFQPVQVTPPLFQKIAYLEKPEGLLALFDQPTWTLDKIPSGHPDLFLVAQSIEKPGNLGAIVRTAAAAGVTAVLIADEAVDPFNPNAIRSSTGAVFTMPIVSASTEDLLAFLISRHAQILTSSLDAQTPYTNADLTGPTAIVIGSEDQGVTAPWKTAAHTLIKIPMQQGLVDSLNASTSAAILLFEAVRQRQS